MTDVIICEYCGDYPCVCPEYDGSDYEEDLPPEPDDSFFPPES